MSKYFPSKVPPYCNTYWDITEVKVSGMGVSVEADKVLNAHVKICKQCKAAQQSVQLTAAGVESDGEDKDSGGN